MSYLYLRVKNLFLREEGQDLAEYGLLVALIAIVAVVGVTLFGNQVLAFFNGLGARLGIAGG